MSFLLVALHLLCFMPACLPVAIAIFARRSPIAIRLVLTFAGLVAGFYAVGKLQEGGHSTGLAIVLVPIPAAMLAFYVALTGSCLVTFIYYVSAGRVRSAPALASACLLAGCVALGAIYGGRFLAWPPP